MTKSKFWISVWVNNLTFLEYTSRKVFYNNLAPLLRLIERFAMLFPFFMRSWESFRLCAWRDCSAFTLYYWIHNACFPTELWWPWDLTWTPTWLKLSRFCFNKYFLLAFAPLNFRFWQDKRLALFQNLHRETARRFNWFHGLNIIHYGIVWHKVVAMESHKFFWPLILGILLLGIKLMLFSVTRVKNLTHSTRYLW